MVFRDIDKQALKNNSALVLSKISVTGTDLVFTEENKLVSWTYEDYRYVPDTGFIGQFVARILDGRLTEIPSDLELLDKDINLQIGIKLNKDADPTWYDYGNFLITEVEREETTSNVNFKSIDYTKKFNLVYESSIVYPCTALELARDVCSKVGVDLTTEGSVYISLPGKYVNGLNAGDYYFSIGEEYYNFTLDTKLEKYDTIMYISSMDKIVVKKVDSELFSVVRTNIPFEKSSTPVGTSLEQNVVDYCDFTNNDFVIFGNNFDNNVTCRDVMKDIAKLAYSWVRVGEDNLVHIDFKNKSINDIDEYDRLTTDEYYETKSQTNYYGPVNRVVIGMSMVDGENISYSSGETLNTENNKEIVTEDGYSITTESLYDDSNIYKIEVLDNQLTYTEELRKIAIHGCEKLIGLCYIPVNIHSIGHPWLEGDSYIELEGVDGNKLYTYAFNRKLEYQGYITGDISSEAMSITDSTYDYDGHISTRVKRTEIIVDKEAGEINSIVEKTLDTDNPDSLATQISINRQDINTIQNLFQITGGSNLIKNSAFLLDDDVWDFEILNERNNYHTPLGGSFDGALSGSVASKACITLKNTRLISAVGKHSGGELILNNIEVSMTSKWHKFNYMYSMDDNTTATVKLIDVATNSILYSKTYTEGTRNNKIQAETFSFRPDNNILKLVVETTTTLDGSFKLYDMMINSGDTRTWEPSAGEVTSTIIKMSQLGLQVISTGSKIATLITSDGFAVYPISGSGDNITIGENPITSFDDSGLITKEAQTSKVSTGRFVLEERTWDGYEHHIEYFKEG